MINQQFQVVSVPVSRLRAIPAGSSCLYSLGPVLPTCHHLPTLTPEGPAWHLPLLHQLQGFLVGGCGPRQRDWAVPNLQGLKELERGKGAVEASVSSKPGEGAAQGTCPRPPSQRVSRNNG